jgi:energy-coupling factor transporter transmembrane protein EcfT
MKRVQILLLPAGLLAAIILAYLLRDIIRQVVVTPLAYLWWVLRLVYSVIPQVVLWILLIFFLVIIVIGNLVNWFTAERKYEKTFKPTHGTVEILSKWVANVKEGNYYKWMIANRLGKLASEMEIQLENRQLTASPDNHKTLGGSSSEAVRRYLKAGLDESFVDYPQPATPFVRRKSTPFDIDVEEAVVFLESEMEARGGKKHP